MRFAFLFVAIVIALAIVAASHWASDEHREQPTATHKDRSLEASPTLLSIPRTFDPIPVEGLTLSQEELQFALGVCVPLHRPTSISLLAHELRLWGLEQDFSCFPRSTLSHSSGILQAITDAQVAAQSTGHYEASAYMTPSPYGLHIACNGRDYAPLGLAEPHLGHLAASFGAAGVSLDHPMYTWKRDRFTVRDYIADVCSRYSNHDEPEFVASALAHYLKAPYKWTTSSGDVRSLSDVLDKLLAASPGEGVCFGGHVPYALTLLLRMDESLGCLSTQERSLAERRLQEISASLTRTQRATGTWLIWTDARRPALYGSDLMDQVSVTGHHLEWIALAPTHVRPEPAVIRRAVAGLLRDLYQLPLEQRTSREQLPLTHAARALKLLRQGAIASSDR